jgi:hypothetical protein
MFALPLLIIVMEDHPLLHRKSVRIYLFPVGFLDLISSGNKNEVEGIRDQSLF